jgi:hypothetical protein
MNREEIRPHDRADDDESFYHVLVWVALQYSQHTLSARQLGHFMHDIFRPLFTTMANDG